MSQYDYLVFGTMSLRLVSGRDGFSKFLSRFKILRRHLDQTRPNSSNNVRKQILIGCYYDYSVFTPFKPVRFILLGRTEEEYKCNRGIKYLVLALHRTSTYVICDTQVHYSVFTNVMEKITETTQIINRQLYKIHVQRFNMPVLLLLQINMLLINYTEHFL